MHLNKIIPSFILKYKNKYKALMPYLTHGVMANAPCLVSLANVRKCARKDLTFHKKSLMALYKKMCAIHYLNIIHLGFIGKFCSIFLIHCNLPHPRDVPFTPDPTDCPWVFEDEFTCNKGSFQQLIV